MGKKIADRLFVIGVVAVLTAGLIKTVFFPKEDNLYENRKANQLPAFTASAYLDTSYQDGVEDALMDQTLLAQSSKKLYNNTSSALFRMCMMVVLEQNPDKYVDFLGLNVFDRDYIVYSPIPLLGQTERLDRKAANYNECFSNHPDIEFYVYYIENDADINFETNEKMQVYEYFQQQLDLPEQRISRFAVNSFDDFRGNFYRTDHHWNYRGSYLGYTQIAELLGVPEEELLKPREEADLHLSFSGSKAGAMGTEVFSDQFTAYLFSYPPMSVWIDGAPAEDYGRQEAFFAGGGDAGIPVNYSNFYGEDSGEVIFDTGRPEKENLLILGDSYDNAVLKLLASHFGRTYSVDLRNYERSMGSPFALSQYLEEHQISKVLLIGSNGYFKMEEFLLEE